MTSRQMGATSTALLLSHVIGNGLATATDLSVKDAISLLDGALQNVRAFDVSLEITRKNFLDYDVAGKDSVRSSKRSSPLITTTFSRQVFQLGKGRVEFLNRAKGEPTIVAVYDSEAKKNYIPGIATSLIDNVGFEIISGKEDYLGTFQNISGRLGILECLRQRDNVQIHKSPGSQITLETHWLPPRNSVALFSKGFRITLDPSHGFMPKVIDEFRNLNGHPFLLRHLEITEWKDLGGGVWVPVEAITQRFLATTSKGALGEMASEIVLKVDPTSSSWNKKIPDEAFELPLPAGIRVHDRFRNIEYVTGKPDPGKNLKALAEDARQVGPVHSPVRTVPTPSARRSWSTWIAISGLVVVAAIMGYRRLRKQTRIP